MGHNLKTTCADTQVVVSHLRVRSELRIRLWRKKFVAAFLELVKRQLQVGWWR